MEVTPWKFESSRAHLQKINFYIEEEKFSRAQLEELTGGYTVPQIMINNKCIGGYEKLLYLYQNNKLQEILNAK